MTRTPRLRNIVFDLDDTLIVEEAVAHASLESVARDLLAADPVEVRTVVLAEARRRWRAGPHFDVCSELGFASWEGLWSTFEGAHPRLDGLRAWAPGFRRDTWSSVLRSLGIDDGALVEACAAAYVDRQRGAHPLIEGAAATVRSLAENYRLGLLTNGPPDIQWQKLRTTGLADRFEAVVVSGAVGVGKPDPAVFARVLEELGGGPEATLMIGDSWERDVHGARGAGWPVVWISAGRPSPEPELDVPTISRVDELLDHLG
ncbi:MAG: HAD family hydrolase [Acidimicrobiales bacterium]|nr:HAD family hydrolase [Acidimicrobiales bacterium]